MPHEHEAWVERLLPDLTISERALREFAKLNPDVPWLETSEALRARLAGGRLRRRFERTQPRIELVDGRSVPLNYVEVILRGRQIAIIRKDKLGENIVKSVRRIGWIRHPDPAWRVARRHSRRAA